MDTTVSTGAARLLHKFDGLSLNNWKQVRGFQDLLRVILYAETFTHGPCPAETANTRSDGSDMFGDDIRHEKAISLMVGAARLSHLLTHCDL